MTPEKIIYCICGTEIQALMNSTYECSHCGMNIRWMFDGNVYATGGELRRHIVEQPALTLGSVSGVTRHLPQT